MKITKLGPTPDPAQAIVDQVLDLPLETVVVAKPTNGYSSTDCIMRTGPDGWVGFNRSHSSKLNGSAGVGNYAHKSNVVDWIRNRFAAGCEFTAIELKDLP